MYCLPAMDLVFSHGSPAEGPRTLEDGAGPAAEPDAGLEQPAVVEMRLESFPAPGGSGFPPAERPHLLAILSDGSLLLYRAARKQVSVHSRAMTLLRAASSGVGRDTGRAALHETGWLQSVFMCLTA